MDTYLISIWLTTFIGWLLYRKFSEKSRFFEKYGIPYEKPLPVLGTSWRVVFGKESMVDELMRQYRKFKSSLAYGCFNLANMGGPNLVLADPEAIRQVSVKDFEHFVNHDKSFNEEIDAFQSKILFVLTDERWRSMRQVLSPIFTSSKMKMMFGILSDCARDFVDFYEEKARSGKRVIVDCNDAYPRYTVDGISTAVLGFKGDCIRNEHSRLYKLAMDLRTPTLLARLKFVVFLVARWLYVRLGLQLTAREVRDFFHSAIVKVMDEREARGIFRPDVVQLLLQARKGQLHAIDRDHAVDERELSNFAAHEELDVGSGGAAVKMRTMSSWTDEYFMAQGFLFFAAGFETTNILLQVTSFCLAKNRAVQDELVREVDEVLATLGGKPVTYDALHRMKYLDMVVSEALRFWPPSAFTNRQCNRNYALRLSDGRELLIEDGDRVIFPIMGLHHDERFFEEPATFDPLRFSDERKHSIVPGSYIPFGYGPRVCIGSRFALMEAKLLIFSVLSRFTMEVCEKTPERLDTQKGLVGIAFAEHICVEYRPRKLNG